MKTWYIYALKDPTTGNIRYVGWSYNVARRLYGHLNRAGSERKTHKDLWLLKLIGSGSKPTVEVLETGNGDWQSAERRWIAYYRSVGADLTNSTDGGEGVPGASENTRKKMREAGIRRNAAKTAEELKQWSQTIHAARGPVSEETKAKISRANGGRTHTDEAKARISAARKAATTEETRQKLREARLRQAPMSEESKARRAEKLKDWKMPEEGKAKISRANKGRKHSEDARAKMKDAAQRRIAAKTPEQLRQWSQKVRQARTARSLTTP